MLKGTTKTLALVACLAAVNVAMYILFGTFWIGGSSFLPMIGKLGPNQKFILAATVNLGVIIGALIGAVSAGEFKVRLPKLNQLPKAILGGFMIGVGVTLAPGTCTTAFVTGMPMLSVSSFLSAAGMFIGAFIMYKIMWRP